MSVGAVVKVSGSIAIILLIWPTCAARVYDVDVSAGLGRTFDGVGAISGGGATSKLLVNYPEEQRNQVLDYLFKPNFGASLHILKVEIGGDVQSTEGSESSHMHEAWDESYERGYEWWMMKEAKKRNPAIKLYGLPWGFPGWLSDGALYWPYRYPNVTADYIARWVLAAKRIHQLDIDYIGIWNEKAYDVDYVKVLRAVLNERGLRRVQLVVGDLIGADSWMVTGDLIKDAVFNSSVDIVGGHYTGTWTTEAAKQCGKPLWSSEDYSTFNDDNGGGCFARLINQNYVSGLMTSTIAWNLIASYYDDLPIRGNGLMYANEPWTGHYEVRPPIWAAAHTTQFTRPGWRYLPHGSGVGRLSYGGSYVTLLSPDSTHLTVIIETMDTWHHDMCLRPPNHKRKVLAQNATFQLHGNLSNASYLNVWTTKLFRGSQASNYFSNSGTVKVVDGQVRVFLEVNSIYTLTTVSTGSKGDYPKPPTTGHFPLPYVDNFEAYPEFGEANNFAQQVGAFEVRQTNDAVHGKVMRQAVIHAPIHWCPTLKSTTLNVIGNYQWSNVSISVDVLVPSINGSAGVFVAAHVDQGGCLTEFAQGIFFFLHLNKNTFEISRDLALTKSVHVGQLQLNRDTWYSIRLTIKSGSMSAEVNSKIVYNQAVPMKLQHGFAGLGTETFGLADFDNFSVKLA